jgi:probable F420-dependent oxidoreductase
MFGVKVSPRRAHMKIGFFAVGIADTSRPEMITAIATNAERLGFATVWAPEHVVLIENFVSRYPYSGDGKIPIPTTIPLLDPFIALTYAAAHTSRIRLATGVCILPEHNPLVLAKVAASLDYLSNGRFALGIGIGWLEEEFKAIGVPWARRTKRTREYVEAMRKLWGDESSTYHGEFVNFDKARSFPKPVNGRQLPILVGGQTDPALKRAAAYGDGWCGFNLSPEETAMKVDQLRNLIKAAGRQPDKFEISMSPPATAVPADLKRYRDAGVDELYLSPVLQKPPANIAELERMLEGFARDWIEPAAKL